MLSPNLKSDFENSFSFRSYLRFKLPLLCNFALFRISRTFPRIIFRFSRQICAAQVVGFLLCCFPRSFSKIFPKWCTYCIIGFARFHVFRGFFGSFTYLRRLSSRTLIVWGGCRFRPFPQKPKPLSFRVNDSLCPSTR